MKDEKPSFDSLLNGSRRRLKAAGLDSADLDARLLLQDAAGISHASLISMTRECPDGQVVEKFANRIERRLGGEPVHRILGSREFYGREFRLSAETLVPRPDTEILVSAAVEACRRKGETGKILDIGTGSGCIAVTLAAELPGWDVTATDISVDALLTAAENAASHHVSDRVEFAHSDMFGNLAGTYDAIVSNPPYICSKDISGLSREVREHDPITALDGGEDGLDFYRVILEKYIDFLNSPGLLFLEVGHDQAAEVTRLAAEAGLSELQTVQDYAGFQRVVIGKRG
ncbi:MAG: peptide chain release factor N(5)-glutamine methyltransferase [Rhizobiaceae bacterium]|jgi:release factor glutamine methyltransferase|nr:peptide chain release factor N(5)-glutamine methyltransferase [Rhizobiaceae bacterium]